jgi:hypothetical protein
LIDEADPVELRFREACQPTNRNYPVCAKFCAPIGRFEGIYTESCLQGCRRRKIIEPKIVAIVMLESSDFAGTPQLDYEAWKGLIRSNFGADPEVSEPNAFAVWRRPLSVCGLAVAAIKLDLTLLIIQFS